ncbi:MAG: hypothetical protein ABIG61_17185, partial [Planctomycetota bacterium]
LPGIGQKIISYHTLDSGQVLVKQSKGSIEIHLSKSDRDETATVIELKIDGMAFDINPVEVVDPTI